jgi:hypothetical protein
MLIRSATPPGGGGGKDHVGLYQTVVLELWALSLVWLPSVLSTRFEADMIGSTYSARNDGAVAPHLACRLGITTGASAKVLVHEARQKHRNLSTSVGDPGPQ